jgi:hypothetical protein
MPKTGVELATSVQKMRHFFLFTTRVSNLPTSEVELFINNKIQGIHKRMVRL